MTGTPRRSSVRFALCALAGLVWGAGLCSVFSARAVSAKSPAHCASYVFFDLGNTLVDTKTTDFKAITYVPGAREYLDRLEDGGACLGMITNTPGKWGPSEKSRITALKKDIADHWSKTAPAMDWTMFPDERILTPPDDAHRKPDPYLFRRALEIARKGAPKDTPVVFQGDDAREVEVARAEGLVAYRVGGDAEHFFMPLEKIRDAGRSEGRTTR